ncbi:hypothetical protein JOH48_007809 [Bradyrhizobium elkanii]|nr:hypothetical protein [Bradyrhizobium elkanii]
MISRDMSFERELIEQRGLFDFPMLYHDLQSCQLKRDGFRLNRFGIPKSVCF